MKEDSYREWSNALLTLVLTLSAYTESSFDKDHAEKDVRKALVPTSALNTCSREDSSYALPSI